MLSEQYGPVNEESTRHTQPQLPLNKRQRTDARPSSSSWPVEDVEAAQPAAQQQQHLQQHGAFHTTQHAPPAQLEREAPRPDSTDDHGHEGVRRQNPTYASTSNAMIASGPQQQRQPCPESNVCDQNDTCTTSFELRQVVQLEGQVQCFAMDAVSMTAIVPEQMASDVSHLRTVSQH